MVEIEDEVAGAKATVAMNEAARLDLSNQRAAQLVGQGLKLNP